MNAEGHLDKAKEMVKLSKNVLVLLKKLGLG